MVTLFSARNISMSTVPARSDEIWKLITDPDTLAALTPIVQSIEASGSHWQWTLTGLKLLGLKIDSTFTERMEFTEGRQIVFSHDPPHGKQESTGIEGVYDLTPVSPEATDLKVDLILSVNLPLPGLSRGAVEGLMLSMMRATGRAFASNLYERLDLDPSTVEISEMKPS